MLVSVAEWRCHAHVRGHGGKHLVAAVSRIQVLSVTNAWGACAWDPACVPGEQQAVQLILSFIMSRTIWGIAAGHVGPYGKACRCGQVSMVQCHVQRVTGLPSEWKPSEELGVGGQGVGGHPARAFIGDLYIEAQ